LMKSREKEMLGFMAIKKHLGLNLYYLQLIT